MEHTVKVKSVEHVTHDVLGIVTQKPSSIRYSPGQATEIFVNKEKWRTEGRPFTFTSIPAFDYLEFTIKTYPTRQGVTNQLLQLKANDELILKDIFGDIAYKGPGVFIAGGAGITPFLSILRDLQSKGQLEDNQLLFASKTKADIIREQEFNKMLGGKFVNILSDENMAGYKHGFVTEELLKPYIHPGRYVYLCGPPPMMDAAEKLLAKLKVDEKWIVKEGF